MTKIQATAMLNQGEPWVVVAKSLNHSFAGKRGRIIGIGNLCVRVEVGKYNDWINIEYVDAAPFSWQPLDPIRDAATGAIRYLACPVPGVGNPDSTMPGTTPDSRWFATEHRGFGAVSVVNVADAVRVDEGEGGVARVAHEGQGASTPIQREWKQGQLAVTNAYKTPLHHNAVQLWRKSDKPGFWIVRPGQDSDEVAELHESQLMPLPPSTSSLSAGQPTREANDQAFKSSIAILDALIKIRDGAEKQGAHTGMSFRQVAEIASEAIAKATQP